MPVMQVFRILSKEIAEVLRKTVKRILKLIDFGFFGKALRRVLVTTIGFCTNSIVVGKGFFSSQAEGLFRCVSRIP